MLPVIAPAWLPALLKISVQILFVPEGRKIPKFMNDQEGSENSVDWKNEQSSRQREKHSLPSVAVLRPPEIAVPVRPTGYEFTFGKDQHFFHHPSSVYTILAQPNFWHKRHHLHARPDRDSAKYWNKEPVLLSVFIRHLPSGYDSSDRSVHPNWQLLYF